MGDVKVSIRLPEELLEIIRAAEDNMSEGIRDTLTRAYATRKVISTIPEIDTRISETRAGVTRADFTFPVGDVICVGTNPQTQLWWCPDERLLQLRERTKVWTEGGFSFHVGKKGGGTWHSPEVIEEEEQERRVNGRFSPSCKMMNALVGDRLVWLEIKDPDKALEFMMSHTDIPCAVRCDVHKYSSDTTYSDAFDKANEIFIYYWINGKSKRLSSEPLSKSDVESMLDL